MSYLARLNTVLDAFHLVNVLTFDGTEDDFIGWDAMIEVTLELWDKDPTMSAAMAGMSAAERWTFASENCDDDFTRAIARECDLAHILSLVDAIRFAESSDDDRICDQLGNLCDALFFLAPQWYKDLHVNDGLYGTDFPGDPSGWSIVDTAELCATLAIGSM